MLIAIPEPGKRNQANQSPHDTEQAPTRLRAAPLDGGEGDEEGRQERRGEKIQNRRRRLRPPMKVSRDGWGTRWKRKKPTEHNRKRGNVRPLSLHNRKSDRCVDAYQTSNTVAAARKLSPVAQQLETTASHGCR